MTSDVDPWSLVEPHRERLLSVAWRRTGNREDAEDIAQEAMVKVATYTALDPARVGQLLTATTMRLCTDLARHRAVVARVAPRLYQPADDALTDLLDDAEARFLATVPLTKVERTLLVARIHGLYPSEVAASLGLSVPAAKSALLRARRKIIAAWKATLGLIGASRLRRLLPVGGAAVVALAGLALHLARPPVVPGDPAAYTEPSSSARVATEAPARPAQVDITFVSEPTVRTPRPSSAVIAPPVETVSVPVPVVEGPVWHKGSTVVIDTSEDPVTRVGRCVRDGVVVDVPNLSVTCRE